MFCFFFKQPLFDFLKHRKTLTQKPLKGKSYWISDLKKGFAFIEVVKKNKFQHKQISGSPLIIAECLKRRKVS